MKFLFEKFIFYPQKNHPLCTLEWKACEIALNLNHQNLRGWLIHNEHIQEGRFVIYYGGNAEDISLNLSQMSKIDASSFLFMNYRGYGGSSGRPTQMGLLEDALAIYDAVVKQYAIHSSRIFLLGRSLGSSIASYVANQRKVAGLILVTPFDSIENLVNQTFGGIPLGWFFKDCFDTRKYLTHVDCQILVLAAEHDEVIPPECLQSLVSACAAQTSLKVIKGADHQNISEYDEYYAAINKYLRR